MPLIFLAALLFSAVGHGGASAYLAAFALIGLAPASMRPAALCLNVLVASIGLYKFYKVRAFHWQIFWPIAVTSVPAAFIGGLITLPNQTYKIVVGLCLIYAAFTIFMHANKQDDVEVKAAHTVHAGAWKESFISRFLNANTLVCVSRCVPNCRIRF